MKLLFWNWLAFGLWLLPQSVRPVRRARQWADARYFEAERNAARRYVSRR
jgi:hypothetical protein